MTTTINVGDKFRLKQITIDAMSGAYYLLNRQPITTDSVFEIKDIKIMGNYVMLYFDGAYLNDGTPNELPFMITDIILCKDETKTTEMTGCTCNNFDLFNRGCKCGWIQIERQRT